MSKFLVGVVDLSRICYTNHRMNKEEKNKRLAQIRRLEGLLAYAIKHNEVEEIERLRKALDAVISTL